MEASSREEVFISLRQKGIKAIKVVSADGRKANGEVYGIRKRIVVFAVLSAILLTMLVFLPVMQFVLSSRGETSVSQLTAAKMRRQMIGDTAIIEKGIRTGWCDVFAQDGERFFASFAIPGVRAGQRSTTVEELSAALNRQILPKKTDNIEVQQIKAMVEGMKDEARRYVAAGGSIIGYGKRLTERQDAEIAIYDRAKTEIDSAKATLDEDSLLKLWETRNDQLRNLGIRLIPLPE